jgi:hypothetical protein
MGQVRVVVTRIEPDGTMHRRMVDTAQQTNPRNWEHLAARALAIQPPYRPIPGTAAYHLRVDGHIIQVGEYDLEGPLRDLAVVVLAIGSTLLPHRAAAKPGSRTGRRCQRGPDDHRRDLTHKPALPTGPDSTAGAENSPCGGQSAPAAGPERRLHGTGVTPRPPSPSTSPPVTGSRRG